jgi:uncharacterized protein
LTSSRRAPNDKESVTAPDLTALPFLDGHAHPPLTVRPADADAYRCLWYEGNQSYVRLGADMLAYRDALGMLAGLLHAPADEKQLVSHLAALDAATLGAACRTAGRIEGVVLDTGYPPPALALSAGQVADDTGVRTATLVRVESVAELLLADAANAADLAARVADALRAALDAGAAGLKSVIAYRSGLEIAPVDLSDADAAFQRLLVPARRGEPIRLADKALCDLVVHTTLAVARERGVAVQLHTGYGDRDADLRLGNPLLLRGLLESGSADGVPLVLLHAAYPYTREAALLAAVHEHVYLDIAACVPPLGFAAVVDCFRIALAVAPISRIQASSDAAGVIEQVLVGAVRSRAALSVALGELYDASAIRAHDAEQAAAGILADNARRLYFSAA